MPLSAKKPNKVVLAAGGTGGHMFPAQALARELLSRGIGVVLITDARGGGFGPDLPQVETHRIPAGAMAGAGLVKKLRSMAQLGLGYLQARGHLKRCGAEVAVGFGGYPSVPTVLAAAHRGLRVVLHEQNSVLGRANRLLAPRAEIIATCFDKVDGVTDTPTPCPATTTRCACWSSAAARAPWCSTKSCPPPWPCCPTTCAGA